MIRRLDYLSATIFLTALAFAPKDASANCPIIVFNGDSLLRVIQGIAPTEDALCYRLETKKGQQVTMKILRRDNIVLTIEDVVDADDHVAFTAKSDHYDISVEQLMRARGPQAFTLSIEKSATGSAQGPSGGQAAASSEPEDEGEDDSGIEEDSGRDPYAARADYLEYQNLPAVAKTYVEAVRKGCQEYIADGIPDDQMAGITPVTLPDGTRALILDNELMCTSHYAGANCSNRGCDLEIMAKRGATWKTIFNEHLYRNLLSIGDDGKLTLITASIYAGDPHCKPAPGRKFESSQSCDVMIRYEHKRWVWQKIQ